MRAGTKRLCAQRHMRGSSVALAGGSMAGRLRAPSSSADRLAGTDMFNGEGGAVTTSIFGKSGKPDVRTYNNIFITNGRTNPAATSNNLWSDGAGTFTFDRSMGVSASVTPPGSRSALRMYILRR